jgi:hypothetical protein
MVLITQSRRLWLVGMAVSLGIFLVLYFTVIRPDNNAANQALKTGLQQSQQVLKQAQQQVNSAAGAASSQTGAASGQTGAASGQTGAASGTAGSVSAAAGQAVSKAQKLAACVVSAGTDTTKLQSCQSQYGG